MNRKDRIQLMLRILEREIISEQMELQTRLRKEGVFVTQATLSRDLAAMHVVKLPQKGGISRYVVPEVPAPKRQNSQLPHDCIEDIAYSGQFVVLRTQDGYAQAVANELDRHRGTIIYGTIAGQNTVLVIPTDGQSRETLRYLVERMLE